MRDARFSSSHVRRLTRLRQKYRRIFAPNGAIIMWSFHNQIPINFLIARCRKHCWSASRVFLHSFCPQNIFVALKIVAIFREFDFSRNKTKNAGLFRKNAGRKAKCRISRTIVGWLTPRCNVQCQNYVNAMQSN